MLTAQMRRALRKAIYDTTNLSGGTDGGLLTPDQVRVFLKIATDAQAILSECDTQFPKGPVWEENSITFHGTRVMKAGATNAPEGDRVPTGARVKPTTGKNQITTQLFKGEVPITEEALEDNIEQFGHLDNVMALVAEAAGRDFEEVGLKSKSTATAHTDELFAQYDGWLQKMDAETPVGQVYTATGVTDPETVFDNLIDKMPNRFRRSLSSLRIYCAPKVVNAYTRALISRGTNLGDQVMIAGVERPKYRNIPIVEVPLLGVAAEAGIGNIDYSKYAFCTDPKNLIAVWQRKMRVIKYEDVLSSVFSILVSGRFATGRHVKEAITFTKTIDSIS